MTRREQLQFVVRGCTEKDLPTVIGINEIALPEHYPRFFYESILAKYPAAFLVAATVDPQSPEKEKLVGYIMWRLERGISEFGIRVVRKGHLVSLAVLEGYRRQGVATALLRKGMEEIAKYGAQEFVLEVRVSNLAAINLYRNVFHFEVKKVIEDYYRDGENAYYMAYRP
ncbi:MAG: ribosomal protein S18-alanine N-acetyltransferase [Promethearchaeota archaeon]